LGGAAGAAAPVIGWVVAAGQVSLEPMLPAFIIFMWTPPHFWALSVIRTGDYARAAVPALPVVSGTQNTTQQILFYTLGLAGASVLPWLFGFSGFFYGITALVLDTIFLALALSLHRNAQQKRNHARKMFAFSILYLFAIFAALLLDIILRPAVRSFLPL
jgi:protoheme IX farnesyltransferase